MGEMLRNALFGMAGWWIALILLVFWAWSMIRSHRRYDLAQLEIDAAMEFATSLKNPPAGMLFLQAYSDGLNAAIERQFPTWPDFRAAYLERAPS